MPVQLFLAEATSYHLVGWWWALLMYLPFLPWAWLVSAKLDKDAKYFHLNRRMWNGIHMAAGGVALAAMVLIPLVILNWVVGIIVLLTPVLVYWRLRNQAVPEDQRYKLTAASLSSRLDQRRAAKAAREAVIQIVDASGQRREIPAKDDPRFATHMVLEDVVGPAVEGRASRVDLAIGPNGSVVTQTVDGVRFKRPPVSGEAGQRLMDYLKEAGGLDVEDRRRRQAGHLAIVTPSGKKEVDIITAGKSAGQMLRLEFDRSKRLSKPFDGLGLLSSQMEALKLLDESHERHGVVLLGAPPGHGLSTTAYSLLGQHDAYTCNIKSLEGEVLLHLDGVDHVKFDPTNPSVDYAGHLQSILRRDPDIILAGHVRDAETARVVTEPGMQGPLIYVPQPLPTIVDQVRQWVKLVGDVKVATKALRAVTNQRLMRTLCPNCRQSYQPSPEQLKKLNLPAERAKQLYRASGKVQVKNKIEPCPVCGGSGYLGQTAAFEVFVTDGESRKMLGTGDLKAALAHARRNKMIYLQESALSKVVSGETSLEEVIRVTVPSKADSGKAA